MKINFKRLILFFAVVFAVGGLAALITSDSMEMYDMILKPVLAPPPIVFPIAWSVLYALMAVGAYLVSVSKCEDKMSALSSFFVQLGLNFVWPILFFNLKAFLVSFFWLVFLWLAIFDMIKKFSACSKIGAYLQLPYIVWVTFAGYLNLMVWLLNK